MEMSAQAAEIVLDARKHALARWERMVGAAAMGISSAERRQGWASGRFDGQPLLDALKPLMEQPVLRLPPPKAKGGIKKRTGKGLVRPKVTRRRQRSRMARYRFDNKAGKYV